MPTNTTPPRGPLFFNDDAIWGSSPLQSPQEQEAQRQAVRAYQNQLGVSLGQYMATDEPAPYGVVPGPNGTLIRRPLTRERIEQIRLENEALAIQQQIEAIDRRRVAREAMRGHAKTFGVLRSMLDSIVREAPYNYDEIRNLVFYMAQRYQGLDDRGQINVSPWHGYGTMAARKVAKFLKKKTGLVYELNYYDEFALIHPDSVYRYNDHCMTEDDYNEHYSTCDGCADDFENDDVSLIGDERFCNSCRRDQGYVYCDSCSEYTNNCESCEESNCSARNQQPGERLYSYSTNVLRQIPGFLYLPEEKQQLMKRGGGVPGNNLFFGIELEVLPRRNVHSAAALKACGVALDKFAIAKSDGSLEQGGFEMVTVPATLEFHRKKLWNKFFGDEGQTTKPQKNNKNAPAHKVRSWNTGCCGLHIHFSRRALSPMQLAKFLTFMHEPDNNEFLTSIAGRKIDERSQFCWARKKKLSANLIGVTRRHNTVDLDGTLHQRLVMTDVRCGDHYEAASISHHTGGETVEVRIFKGNASRHGVMRALDFVAALISYCAESKVSWEMKRDDGGKFKGKTSGLHFQSFLDWFSLPNNRGAYPDLWRQLLDLNFLKTEHVFRAQAEDGTFTHTRICSELNDEELAAPDENENLALRV